MHGLRHAPISIKGLQPPAWAGMTSFDTCFVANSPTTLPQFYAALTPVTQFSNTSPYTFTTLFPVFSPSPFTAMGQKFPMLPFTPQVAFNAVTPARMQMQTVAVVSPVNMMIPVKDMATPLGTSKQILVPILPAGAVRVPVPRGVNIKREAAPTTPVIRSQIPLLDPAPGSKNSATPRKRFCKEEDQDETWSPSAKAPAKKMHAKKQHRTQESTQEKNPGNKRKKKPNTAQYVDSDTSPPHTIEPRNGNNLGIVKEIAKDPSSRKAEFLKLLASGATNDWSELQLLNEIISQFNMPEPIQLPNKAYTCAICVSADKKDIEFKHLKHCRRHLLTHVSIKPFNCPMCSSSFHRKDTCVRHIKRCRKD